MKKGYVLTALLVLFFGLGSVGYGQQVIGSFPNQDGGFEGQTTGSLTSTSSTTSWWLSSSITGTIVGTGGRSGSKYSNISMTGSSHRTLRGPAIETFTASTAYVIQFYYKGDKNNDGTSDYGDIRGGINGSTFQYSSYTTNANTGSTWTKFTASVTPGASTATGHSVVSIIEVSGKAAEFDIDDVVIYAGSSADVTAPNSPGTVTVNNPTTSSLDVSWDAAIGGYDGGGYVVVRYATSPNPDNDPNQNGIYAVGNTHTNGTDGLTGTVRYIGTGTSFTDNSGLSAGTTYYYKVYTVDKAFNYSTEAQGSGTTSSLSGSSSSDIITANNETTNIDYASKQSSTITTTSDALRVWSFTIRDGGGSADADAFGTELTALTIGKGGSNTVSSWTNTIRKAALFDGSTNVTDVDVTGETISFSGMSGANVTAADDGSKTLDLYLTFETTVTDNQQFQFLITSVTANPSGSNFAASDGGGALSSITGDNNKIEVTATKLAFVQQPSNVEVGAVMSPDITISADDGNNNRDYDYATNVELSTTGTFAESATTVIAPTSGLATFSNIIFSAAGTGITVTGSSGSLTSTGSSSTFNVTSNFIDLDGIGSYSQDFNTLANSGTSSSVPTGWFFSESGSNANSTYTAGTGSGTSGDTYSFGTDASDRALGTLRSSSLISTIGAKLKNSTGTTITQLPISYTGEQWRLGATGRNDKLDFQYSTNATSLTTGDWTDFDALDFTAPISTGSAGALDGNLEANRVAISSTITGLNVANGSTIWIRWTDPDASSSDDGLGIDDFSINETALPVELTSFTAKQTSNAVVLNWSTATEVNNYGFEVQRTEIREQGTGNREQGTEKWDMIGFVQGNGNSNSEKSYSFTDRNVASSTKYIYRLKQIDTDGKFDYSNEVEVLTGMPEKYALAQNYPNPFNPSTVISYQLMNSGNVKLVVYDILGKEIAQLVNGKMDAGSHSVDFNASGLQSGIYFYKITVTGSEGSLLYSSTNKMSLIK